MNTSTALDDCRGKQIHDQPSIHAKVCAKSSADAYTCRHTQSPQYMTTYEDTNTALSTRQPMQIHASFDTGQLMLVHAELLIRAKTCNCAPGIRIMKTNANTGSALDAGQGMRNHDRISRIAETCTIMLSCPHTMISSHEPTNAGACQALSTCRNDQLSILANI